MNQIFSIMSLTMMGLILGPLMRDIFIFALNNLLVVLMTPLVVLTTPFVAFVVVEHEVFFPIVIESIGDGVPLVVFLPIIVDSKGGRFNEIFWHPKS